MRKTKSAGDEIVTMDRRSTKDRRANSLTKSVESKSIGSTAVGSTAVAGKPSASKPSASKTVASKPAASKLAMSKPEESNNRREPGDRRTREAMPESMAKLIAEEKRKVKVQRRRQIDPTTCERDYSGDEIVFMQAMDEYKRKNGRMFPTCSEILEVVRSIGYVKVATSEPAPLSSFDD